MEAARALACAGRLCQFALIAFSLVVPATAESSPLVDELKGRAAARRLWESPVWTSLLHVRGGPSVADPSFLLSLPTFSLESELNRTIEFLYGGPIEATCRFPARYSWLRDQLSGPALSQAHCTDLQEFRRRAPTESLALVFASENLGQPASVMGHLFLKLSGTTPEGHRVDHAISFFTDGGGWNLPKLFIDSIVTGKNGFFALAPYAEQVAHYVTNEGRGLWEYEIQTSDNALALFHDHLIELKQTSFRYFFQKYNCATLINFILSVAVASDQEFARGIWVTPRDVIKRANALGVIQDTRLLAPARWTVRALAQELDGGQVKRLRSKVSRYEWPTDGAPPSDDSFARLIFASAYHAYRVERGWASGDMASAYQRRLDAALGLYTGTALTPARYRNPLFTPPDSQVSVGVSSVSGTAYGRLTFAPTSHRLEDDNRQYFAESELLLFEVSLLQRLGGGRPTLDRLTIYSTRSLLPRGPTSSVTSEIRLSFERQPGDEPGSGRMFWLGAGAGKTQRVANDIDLFFTLGGGIRYKERKVDLALRPTAGFVIREVFSMKTVVQALAVIPASRNTYASYTVVADQAKYISAHNLSLHATARFSRTRARTQREFEFTVKRLF